MYGTVYRNKMRTLSNVVYSAWFAKALVMALSGNRTLGLDHREGWPNTILAAEEHNLAGMSCFV